MEYTIKGFHFWSFGVSLYNGCTIFIIYLFYTQGEIANIIAVGGATDMTARLLLGVAGQFFRINSRQMFFAGALLAAVFRIGKYFILLSRP